MKSPSLSYRKTIKAAELFLNIRQLDPVKGEIPSARLFCSGLRSLDVYDPTKTLVEQIVSKAPRLDLVQLRSAVENLELLIGARYLPELSGHQIFAKLLLYDRAWNRVVGYLSTAKASHKELNEILLNFETALSSVVSGNGLYIVNWKHPPVQCTTLYTKVGLEISRLCCGDAVGIYKVKIKARGKAPHHSHSLLDEHHFLPEKINGIHYLGRRAARCTAPDILYVKHGQIHAFRNDENEDRSFLFISGSPELGPWDFVQDITTYPELGFPQRLENSIKDLGGRALDLHAHDGGLERRRGRGFVRRRLSPQSLRLTHDEIEVNSAYAPPNQTKDLQMHVARGRGRIQVVDRTANIRKGDVFVVKSGMPASIVPANGETLILYEFAMGLRKSLS